MNPKTPAYAPSEQPGVRPSEKDGAVVAVTFDRRPDDLERICQVKTGVRQDVDQPPTDHAPHHDARHQPPPIVLGDASPPGESPPDDASRKARRPDAQTKAVDFHQPPPLSWAPPRQTLPDLKIPP